MNYRAMGKTGAQVSDVSMGCNRLGESRESDGHWVSLVRRAVDLGVTLFDTSESYGWGRSEEILGQAIGNRDGVLIADKISKPQHKDHPDAAAPWSRERIIRHAEGCLGRLKRDRIEILQLHSPKLEDCQSADWAEGMARLKQQGKIRWSAVAANDHKTALWLMEHALVDVLQLTYNLLMPDAAQDVLPMAQRLGVGTMVRMPMERGILSGKFSPGSPVPADARAMLNAKKLAAQLEQAEPFRKVADDAGMTMAMLAMRYAMAPAGVSAIIPGARNIEQLEANVAVTDGPMLSEKTLAAIDAIQKGWQA